MLNFIITLILFNQASALIGYDCGSRQLNVTTLSLQDVGDCDISEDSINVTRQYVQLLQINEYTETPVYQCKLEIHRTVYYCGMHSHVSIVLNGENEYIYEISRRACLQLHETGIGQIGPSKVITGLMVNSTSTHSVTFAGYVNLEGKCKGSGYADPYGSWESVVVQGTVKITLTEQIGRVKLEDNKIHLNSGTVCKLADGSCLDSEGGYTFWHPIPSDRCKFYQYGILYEGLANKVIDRQANGQIMYTLATKDVTFALAAKGRESVCGYMITKTEHPKLLIFETERGNSFALNKGNSISNLDIFAYVNSKFVYVEKHIRAQIKGLYRDVMWQKCTLERQTIKNSLSLATQAPDEFAFDLMKGPGYMAVVAGEVVHIVKCIPVEVKLEHGEHCYAELQVSRNNQTYYLTPRTHILKSQGTRMPCNKLLPAHYFINGAWYKMLPMPIEAKQPSIIKPMTQPTWEYTNPAELATSGIYSESDIEQLRERIMFPVERPAILNDLAREMRGHPIEDNEGAIVKLLNEDAVEKIINSTWGTIWNKFMTFGTVSAGIMAILMIIHIVKLIVDIAIQGYALHSVYGWSIHLLGAIWSSLTHLLIYLGSPTKPTVNSERQTTQEESTTTQKLEDIESMEMLHEKIKKKHQCQENQKRMEATSYFALDG